MGDGAGSPMCRGRTATLCGWFLAVILALLPRLSWAREPNPASDPVEWSPSWPRFRWWEYFGAAAFEASSVYLRWYQPPPQQPKWQGSNAFDDTVRDWLRAETLAGRTSAANVSDWVSFVGTFAPLVIDPSVALVVHRNVDVGWQLLMMDLEAMAVANFVNNLLYSEVGRARPDSSDCAKDPSYNRLCGIGSNASLPSGHTVTIATATGLTCSHHRYLPLYGNSTADDAACAVMVLATLTTGVSRVVADRHFATDVLLGAAIGFGSGYGLPWLLHYRYGGMETSPHTSKVVLFPFAADKALGLGVMGLL